MHFKHACVAALMTLLLTLWLFGFQLQAEGVGLTVVNRLDGNGPVGIIQQGKNKSEYAGQQDGTQINHRQFLLGDSFRKNGILYNTQRIKHKSQEDYPRIR